ncbi:Myosin-10 [Camellia lanceoleosa]|uniref:Myosin-10 n=1 Tax=Camellia lanceoleosa TaxID=1840588 RepID=A0ACC0GD46_9ERIC|nr:Myosin-10 [Camellia lanceoleosa]
MSSQAVEKRKETLALCYLLYIHRHFMLQDQDSNAHMAYWLSNTSVLLFLLQRTLKATGGKPPTPTSFVGRMTQDFDHPFLLPTFLSAALKCTRLRPNIQLCFSQQCTTYVEKIYGIVQDNSKKDLSALLSSCIQGCCNSKSQRYLH